MKIKQIEKILKAKKTIYISEANGAQWLSDGAAFYPVYNLPKLTEENIFVLFDIPEDKRDKFRFKTPQLPTFLNFEDSDENEQMIDRSDFSLFVNGRLLEPLKTSRGIVFIKPRYLMPIDADEGFALYERISEYGRPYIVVKRGFILQAVIYPENIIDDKFVESLETLLRLSRDALSNEQRAKENDDETQCFF